MEKFLKIEETFTQKFNYRRYRAEIENIQPEEVACIPHLAIHLRDILFVNISKTKVDEQVNVEKLMMCGEQIKFILSFQKTKYNFPSNPGIYSIVYHAKSLASNDLMMMSLEASVRQTTKSPKKTNKTYLTKKKREKSSAYDYSHAFTKYNEYANVHTQGIIMEDKRKRTQSLPYSSAQLKSKNLENEKDKHRKSQEPFRRNKITPKVEYHTKDSAEDVSVEEGDEEETQEEQEILKKNESEKRKSVEGYELQIPTQPIDPLLKKKEEYEKTLEHKKQNIGSLKLSMRLDLDKNKKFQENNNSFNIVTNPLSLNRYPTIENSNKKSREEFVSPQTTYSRASNAQPPLTPNKTKMSPFLKSLVQNILDENIRPLQMRLEAEIKRREILEEQVKQLKLLLAMKNKSNPETK